MVFQFKDRLPEVRALNKNLLAKALGKGYLQ
jgi:hypothetical protein